MRSNALTPSTEVRVNCSSVSHKAWMQWATHSHPDFVDRANWNGDVAASTAGPNCWAMVRATSLRMTSPATMPRTPPLLLRRAVDLPTRMTSTIDGGNSPRAKRSATLKRTRLSLGESSNGRKCSHVIPDGPPAAPFFADRKLRENSISSNSNGLWGGIRGTSSRGLGGRLVGSRTAFKVAVVPGARSAPSNACLPLESSPNCTK